MIDKWRFVKYTNDGCSLFQCLHCYEMWDSRTNPEDWYHSKWQYCPYCGCKWMGEQKWDYRKKYMINFPIPVKKNYYWELQSKMKDNDQDNWSRHQIHYDYHIELKEELINKVGENIKDKAIVIDELRRAKKNEENKLFNLEYRIIRVEQVGMKEKIVRVIYKT